MTTRELTQTPIQKLILTTFAERVAVLRTPESETVARAAPRMLHLRTKVERSAES